MTWSCGSCAGDNPVGTRFCGHCGLSREPEQAPVDDLIARLSRGQVPEHARDGRPTEQRRLVTALFADISGFTALGGQLDPEALMEIVDRIISGMSEVVGRYDGYLDKYAGDAVFAFFGAPTSHEDDALRALAVALEMRAGFESIKSELPDAARDLGLHVGINTGHAIARVIGNEVRTDYSVLGDAINVAQRLEAAAPGGEIYIGALTEQLTHRWFELEPIADLTVKGKSRPVAAWRVVGQRVATGDARTLVGRDPDLSALNGSVESLSAGTGGVVIVSGEAGIGKSSLLDVVRAGARSRGVRWLDARAVSYRAASPYEPIVELLVTLMTGSDPTADPAQRLATLSQELGVGTQVATHLAWLFGSVSTVIEELAPEARRSRLQDAFTALLRAISRQGPLVLAFEDLHWADNATVELVSLVGRAAAEIPLLLIVTSRPETGVIERLRGEALDARVVTLSTLSADDVATLVDEVLVDAAPELVETVRRRSGGNPFFAHELIRAIDGSTDLLDVGALPPTIEGALAVRLDRLDGVAAHVIEVAAAIGTEIPIDLLDAVAAVPELRIALKQLVEAGLVERVGGRPDLFTFRHALMQEVAYGRILRRRARALHLDIADAAERLWGSDADAVDLLAHHLYHAGARERAVAALLRAADRAEAVFANDAATVHLRRVLEFFGDDQTDERAPVVLRLADLCDLVGAYEEATHLYGSLQTGLLGARASYGLAASLRKRGEYEHALAVLDAAGKRELSREERAMLLLERGRALMVAEGFDAAITALTAGFELAPPASLVAGLLLQELARAESSIGRVDEALAHGLEARNAFEARQELRHLASALRVLGGVYEDLGRLDDAAESLRAGLALAERTGRVEEIGGCLVNLGLVELARERFDDAIKCNQRAIEELERIGHPARATAYANLAEALLARGDLDEVRAYCHQAVAIASEQHDVLTVADAGLTAAIADLRSGRAVVAAAGAEAAATHFLAVDAKEWAVKALGVAADAWEVAEDASRARAARERAHALD